MLAAATLSTLPAWAQGGSGATRTSGAIPDIFRLSPTIPGTSEYRTQQQAAELEAVLTDLEAIASARVSLREASGQAHPPAAAVQLDLAPDQAWTGQLSQTVVALVGQLVPELPTEAILITDRQGRILFEKGRSTELAHLDPEPETEATALIRTLSGPVAIGIGLGLGLVIVLGWWLVGGRSAARTREEPTISEEPWRFLAGVERAKLKRVLSAERPEVVGAIAAGLDERTAARLRPVLKALGHAAMPAPDRPMHRAIAEAVAASIRQMVAEDA